MAIAQRSHLYPFRTQKLSSVTLMILGGRPPGKVRSCRNKSKGTAEMAVLFAYAKIGAEADVDGLILNRRQADFWQTIRNFLPEMQGSKPDNRASRRHARRTEAGKTGQGILASGAMLVK